MKARAASLWGFAFLIAAGCSSTAVVLHKQEELDATAPTLSEPEAKAEIISLVSKSSWRGSYSNFSVDVDAKEVDLHFQDNDDGLASSGVRLPFTARMDVIQASGGHYQVYGASCAVCDWKEEESAIRFATAVLALKKIKAVTPSKEELGVFDKIASKYRDSNPKPALPESGRRFQIQGDDAAKSHRYEDALSLYKQALDIAPWWPEGHFESARILAVLERYELASSEMKKYLQLVPSGPNWREAQDDVYLWEGRIKAPENKK